MYAVRLTVIQRLFFKGQKDVSRDRPDGLIVIKTGSREWRALVEAKVGSQTLKVDQIEKYRAIAKEQKVRLRRDYFK